MRLFKTLIVRQKHIKLSSSEEYHFYNKHESILEKYPEFAKKIDPDDSFQLVQANIIIRALLNKIAIENVMSELNDLYLLKDKRITVKSLKTKMEELMQSLPYIQDGKNRIFVPIFSRAMNLIYEREAEKLLSYPYNDLAINFHDSLVDPFETYGYRLYDSFFTKLIMIGEDKTCAAFFSIDYLTIYFINNQGRLDNKVPLFDKYVKRINSAQVLTRAQAVVPFYFKNDKLAFIAALREQKLISSRMYHKLMQKKGKRS